MQRAIKEIPAAAEWQCALAWLEDIVVVSRLLPDDVVHTNQVCLVSRNESATLKLVKYDFFDRMTD